MLEHTGSFSGSKSPPLNNRIGIRCPSCRREGIFEPIGNEDVAIGAYVLGERICPAVGCGALIFFVVEEGRVKITFPPERIDFDTEGVPPPVVEAMEEAITPPKRGQATE